jgi:class 3 adenylate cyclase
VTQRTLDDPIAAARQALDHHAWHEAFDLLRQADAERALSAEEFELLGEAAWWSGRMDDCIAARERAFAAHQREGHPRQAARVALQLVRDYAGKLQGSVSSGWFKRAERLLKDQPDSVERGWLEMMRARNANNAAEFDAAAELAARAVDIGARFGDLDLQALALMYQGMAMISRGDVDEGWALLDEATVAAVGGELQPSTTGIVYCNVISMCAEVADYRRAGEWTEAAKRWCDRQAISGFPGLCRVHRAEIMRLRGAWVEAEEEARRACTELQDHGIPAFAGDGFYEVGLVRMRMGDEQAAEDAFQQANELGRDPQPGLALLRLAQGRADAAASMIQRALDETPEPLYRIRKLPARVDIALASGDVDTAESAAAEIGEIAERFGSMVHRAEAEVARAKVLVHRGDAEAAMTLARKAWRTWQEIDAPYEAALARTVLGRAYLAAGDEEGARLELRAARAALEKIGAVPDARQVVALLGDGGAVPIRRATRTFMFTDIVRSTNLVEAIGDEAWEDLVGWHDRTLRALFRDHGGEEVDHAGDGFFVAFQDAGAALRCAVGIQQSLGQHRRSHGFAPQVRVGLHVAEATQRGGDYGGRGVHQAARVGALAEGGEILATEETIAAAGDSWKASDPREVPLKGFSEPVRVVTVDWR